MCVCVLVCMCAPVKDLACTTSQPYIGSSEAVRRGSSSKLLKFYRIKREGEGKGVGSTKQPTCQPKINMNESYRQGLSPIAESVLC